MTTLLLWEVLCVALFWSVFCRSVRVDKTTRLDVRLALWAVGLSALAGLAAPFYGWAPDWVTVGIVAGVVAMQSVMAHHWRDGVPRQFVQDVYRLNRRSGDYE
jgi:hypothetical protein